MIIYTNYCKNLMLPLEQQVPKMKFIAEEQSRLNTTMTYDTVSSWFDRIEDRGLSPYKLSELESQNKQNKIKTPYSKSKELYLSILVASLEKEKEYREIHHNAPRKRQIYMAIAPDFDMTYLTIANSISKARKFPEYKEIIKNYDFIKKGE